MGETIAMIMGLTLITSFTAVMVVGAACAIRFMIKEFWTTED
jgi:hypothetical protein